MTPPPPREATARTADAAPVVLPAASRTRRWSKAYATQRIRQALALEGDTAQALAFDGASILTACLFEAEPPRIVRPMADHRLMELPMLGKSAKRIGAVDGRPMSCINLLRDGATVLTFPEGTRAHQRRFRDRYKLAPFGYGFARVALLARAPIVPVAVIGCEEEAPLLANPRWLRRLVGTHSAPITPTLVFPLPAKHRLWFGDPISLSGPLTSGTVTAGVRVVREALARLLAHGLAAREHVFW
jgi:1-acyl-sn-glycerol-3-phosphate acyltransferase